MTSPKIPGGFYIKARVTKEKKIAHCAPCVREIWDYLLREVSYQDRGSLKRGQLFIRYQDIIDDLKWFVGYRKMAYSMDQTKKAMKVLRRHLMISTTKARNGVLVTLLNYDFYNDLDNYESTNEGTNESTNESTNVPPTINKKLKKEKKKELNTYSEDSNEFRLAKYFYSVLLKSDSENKEPNFQKWASEFDKIIRIDKRKAKDIQKVINYAHDPKNINGDFSWIPNLRSPIKIRKHFSTIFVKCNGQINHDEPTIRNTFKD